MSDATPVEVRFRPATEESPATRWILIGLAFAALAILVFAPLVAVFVEALAPETEALWREAARSGQGLAMAVVVGGPPDHIGLRAHLWADGRSDNVDPLPGPRVALQPALDRRRPPRDHLQAPPGVSTGRPPRLAGAGAARSAVGREDHRRAVHQRPRRHDADVVAGGLALAAPALHLERGLSPDEVVAAVQGGFADGMASAAASGQAIRVRTILTAMRTAATHPEIAELALLWRAREVCGFHNNSSQTRHRNGVIIKGKR